MIYTAPDGIHVLDMATRKTKLLVANPPRDPNAPAAGPGGGGVHALVAGHKTNSVFFTKTDPATGVNAVYKADTNTGAVRKLVDLPPHVSISASTRMRRWRGHVYRRRLPGQGDTDRTCRRARVLRPGQVLQRLPPETTTASPAPRRGRTISHPTRAQMMERRLAARIPLVLFTIRLEPGPNGEKPGDIKPLLHSTDWVNHLLFSPTDPAAADVLPRGPWQKVDRIWMIHTDGTHNTLIHKLPYFAVMIVLALYGVHRYTLCYLYFKYRKNYKPQSARHFDELPRVTVQLPIFNEQFVIDRLIEAVCAMEYPREKLEIQVLDDSTDETQAGGRGIVERYAALGHPIVYIHRTNRHGFKAGALDAGLKVAKGEFVAIFDADFVPPPDWLMKVIHHFAEPEIGMVQTRWTHLNRDYSMLTQIEAILLDGHFVLEHGARAAPATSSTSTARPACGASQAISDGGGWQHDTLTEDTDLSYRSQMAGWKFKYLPDVECPSELPIEMTAFKTQQARWAKGLIQTSIKIAAEDVQVQCAAAHQD
jgi:hypothetical protein